MNRLFFLAIAGSVLLLSADCSKKSTPDPVPPVPPVNTEFAKGADVSWVTEMEAAGKKFYNSAGTEKECMQLLKDIGMNTIRLRVWVNPAAPGWNGQADVIAKAVRAKSLGLKVMIDFHYSDTWADPGHQTKPAAWASQDFSTLKQSLATHTTTVLTALKAAGVTPTWVQVGNETNDGLLWPDGKASLSMSNFAQLIQAGYSAVKAVDNSIRVIVHVSNGFDNGLSRWVFDGLKSFGAQWDIIGLSLYPSSSNWASLNSQCLSNMNDLVSRYGTDVMVVEVGMSWDQASACQSFLADLIAKTRTVSGNHGLGVLYWEPQSYGNWNGYTLGAFDNSGRPTTALNAFN